jgi:hypothetical protein
MKVLTIFGAGASFDSLGRDGVSDKPVYRPPLTDKLFDVNEATRESMKLSPLLMSVHPKIVNCIRRGGTLEDYLSSLSERAQHGNSIELRKKELNEIQLYIRRLMLRCSEKYISSGSNYDLYLHELSDMAGNGILVTFNYDTLLERSLEKSLDVFGRRIRNMEHYLADRFPIIKPHGSCNWVVGSEGSIQILDRPLISKPAAMALPLPSKEFVCPVEHMSLLSSMLPEIERINVIGWRAREDHFMKLLKKGLGKRDTPIRLLVVNSSPDGCKEVVDTFVAYLDTPVDSTVSDGGFSNFLYSNDVEKMR